MEFSFGKIFRKRNTESLLLEIIDYDPSRDIDYYNFIKQQRDNEFIQLIVNSKLMMVLIKYYFIERQFQIKKIEMMEEDEDFSASCNILINALSNDRAKLNDLLDFVEKLDDEESIEIFKISLKYRNAETNEYIGVDIQANGVIKINTDAYENEKNILKDFLVRKLYEKNSI
jgi:hypothetical protein